MAVLLLVAASLLAPPTLAQSKLSVELKLRLRAAPGSVYSNKAPLPLSVRAHQELSPQQIKRFEAQGVLFDRVAGEPARVGVFYGVRATAQGLRFLAEAPEVARVSEATPRAVLPLSPVNLFDRVLVMSEVPPSRARRDSQGQRLTGRGVVIADVDSGIDVLHPLFFHADGGLYAWLDVDHNGTFTAGVDAADINGNGRADSGEWLEVTGGGLVDIYTGDTLLPAGQFVAGRHWLYADANGNQQRDQGPAAGFTELAWAYGEPVFVTDDVDHDGVLDVGEKLLRLRTSKFRRIIRVYSGQVYERGTNLIATPRADESHGTGVCGILVGGVAGHTDLSGVAPDAELVFIDQSYIDGDPLEPAMSLVTAVASAKEHDPVAFQHEYGSPIWSFGDGSDEWDLFLDALTSEGYVQTTAMHNYAGWGGFARLGVTAGATVDIPVEVDGRGGPYPYILYPTIRWQGGAVSDVQATLILPGGGVLGLRPLETSAGNHATYTEQNTSPRGTHMTASYVYAVDAQGDYAQLAQGEWTLRLRNQGALDAEVHVWMPDETGYAYFVSLLSYVTDEGTIAAPATADSAVSVGASAGNDESEVTRGDLMWFSGRGPRIDGALGIEVVAPQDHYTALHGGRGTALGNYMTFGGTSGALPMVTGSLALLLQAEPTLTPIEVRARVEARAVGDAFTGVVPNGDWGYGKLSAYRLLAAAPPPANTAPTALLTVPAVVEPGESVSLDASASSDSEDAQGSLIFRLDSNYDGVWDVETLGVPIASLVVQGGTTWVKLEVEDTGGLVGQALASISVTAPGSTRRQTANDGCSCGAAASGPLFLAALAGWRRRRRV